MDPVINQIRQELKDHQDMEVRKTSQRFFKDEITCYGIRTAIVLGIAKKYWKVVQHRTRPEIYLLCDELYKSGYLEESFIVSNWTNSLAGHYEREDLQVFKSWIETYINNWASCDGFCNHTLGSFMEQYPECIKELKCWAKSPNRWMRRAAAVSLIIPAKHGKFLKESLEIADLLLNDRDDMVQKGYGWLLKEASRKHRTEVYDFVIRNKRSMPRTALRYAIELLPKEMKTMAMSRDW
jgi:3-methyladenine DNA glycosylase AlkD